MYHLQNKIALVGGASQGLGAACAIGLAAAGATVIIYARTEEKLKQVVNNLPKPLDQDHSYLIIDTQNLIETKKIITQFFLRPLIFYNKLCRLFCALEATLSPSKLENTRS